MVYYSTRWKKKYTERERTNKCFPVLTGESAAEGHVVFTALPFLPFYELENFQTKKLKKTLLYRLNDVKGNMDSFKKS